MGRLASEREAAQGSAEITAFRTHVPGAQVVTLANHTHCLFLSDEPEVGYRATEQKTRLRIQVTSTIEPDRHRAL